MNRTEHLMTIAMEECAEITQRLAKAQRFGMGQIQEDADDKPEENPGRHTNRERIVMEVNDLVATLDLLGFERVELFDRRRIGIKQHKIERYMRRSKECGTLDG